MPVPSLANFDCAVDFVLHQEGGWTTDTGGLTRYGISKNAYPNTDISSLTIEDAKLIYRRDYWDPLKLDELPHSVALAMLEAAVNLGLGPAVCCLQRAGNLLLANKHLKVDGVLGPKTRGTVQKLAGDSCQAMLLGVLVAIGRLNVHYRLASHPNYSPYIRGWAGRCIRLCEKITRGCAPGTMEQ